VVALKPNADENEVLLYQKILLLQSYTKEEGIHIASRKPKLEIKNQRPCIFPTNEIA